MSTRRKRPVASFDAAEQLPRNTLPLLPPRLLLFSVLPRQSNFLSAKPCGYLLALIFICLFFIVPAIADAAVVYWNPWVTKTTTNSATINWYGSGTKAGEVEYATSSYYNEHTHFDKTKVSHIDSAYQHVQLTDLEPNTEYTYRVTTSDATPRVFRVSKFRTMPVSGPFTFIVISDTHAQEGRFKYVAAAIEKETDVLFILDGGDYTGHDSNDQWIQYFEAADKMLAKFAIFNTIGNHEYHSSAPETPALHYHGAFDILPSGKLNYSFDCAGIRFIILNSPDPSIEGDPSPTLPLALSQAPWLRDQLDNNMLGTFTIHHHPIWDSGRTTINAALKPWEDLYHAYPISATFSGHTHTYQRYSVKGIPYFVVANAGGGFSNLTPPYAEGWITGETRRLGYLRVTVDPANNTAIAQEIFVASVDDTAVPEIITVYPTPITYDTLTFSLKPTSLKPTGGGSGCFIATAAFGSYFDPSVKILRDFRDKFLFTNHVGQSFVNWYYKVSPPLADLISSREIMKTIARILLLPAVGFAYLCLSVGVLPTLLVLLFSATFIYLGIRRFYHHRYASHV
jgi:predicted phosphodiesterase